MRNLSILLNSGELVMWAGGRRQRRLKAARPCKVLPYRVLYCNISWWGIGDRQTYRLHGERSVGLSWGLLSILKQGKTDHICQFKPFITIGHFSFSAICISWWEIGDRQKYRLHGDWREISLEDCYQYWSKARKVFARNVFVNIV